MINNRRSFFCLLILLLFQSVIYSQPLVLDFEQGLRLQTERELLKSGTLHSLWPVTIDCTADTTVYHDLRPLKGKFPASLVGRKLFNESLISVKVPDFNLIIDPLVNFELGNESGRNTWVNTRGVRADGTIGAEVYFHTAFYESQAVFPEYLDSITRSLAVVPGQASYKDFKGTGFDYAFAEGHVTWAASKFFNFRLGHGKNFIGDGYRSLLLSDVAFNYPYFMINTKVWHIQYTNIYSQFMELTKTDGSDSWDPWNKKFSTMHHLSWNVTPWFNIGLFESIVWQAADSTGYRGFEWNYLNPIIFYRPVEFSLGSPDNALMGGSMRFTIQKKYMLYAQMILDEFKLEHVLEGDGWWANKYGYQLGFKAFDLFNIPNLFVQAEYNQVRPYTYAHSVSLQNYGHYSQPLAHPEGANFREGNFLISYRKQRMMFDYKLVITTYGADTAGLNYGKDIYKSYDTYVNEFGNEIGQGLKTNLMVHDFKVGWLVNPATNLRLNAGVSIRNESSDRSDYSGVHLWVGLRSALFNQYYDW